MRDKNGEFPIIFDHLRLRYALRMSTPRRLLAPVLLALVLPAALARAQPVSFTLKNDVPGGQKPTLTVSAVDKVSDIALDLTRDDGEKFQAKHPGLAPGQSAALPIGDGKPGRAKYTGRLQMNVTGAEPWSYDLAFETLVRAPLNVNYDFEHLDLANHVLRFQLSRPAGRADLTVWGEDGEELGHAEATYKKEPPGTWLPIAWAPLGTGRVMTMRLKAVSADGLAITVDLIPWAVTIEHEDVVFDTDSAVIKPAEATKLDASLAKIQDVAKRAERFIKVKLYVAGNTDTVGSKDHNRKLSLDRAKAIAEYFRKKGLAIQIVYEGFGEEALTVPTADNVDEQKNRRVDYVIGAALSAPPLGGPYRGVHADWKAVK